MYLIAFQFYFILVVYSYSGNWKKYGVPEKTIGMVKIFFEDVKYAVEDQGEIGERFDIKTGVKGGCSMSGFLFLIAVSGQRARWMRF